MATAPAAVLWLTVTVTYRTRPIRELLIRVVPDDALFYLVIARNGAAGKLSSFDGLTLTNGYHPLWRLVLAERTPSSRPRERGCGSGAIGPGGAPPRAP